jgi:hypothetical protein
MLHEGGGDWWKVMIEEKGKGRREIRRRKRNEKKGEERTGKEERREREDSRHTCPRHISSMHRIACGRRDIAIIFEILFIIVPGSGSILGSRRNRRVEVSVAITIIVVDRSSSRGGNTPITSIIVTIAV